MDNKFIDNKDKDFDFILNHIPEGKGNGISMKDLAAILGVKGRDIRAYILAARISGNIIASDNSGYYIPSNENELKTYYFRAKGRLISTSRSLKAVRDKLRESGVKP